MKKPLSFMPDEPTPMTMPINTYFCLGIPTINRADLLNPALEQYVCDFPNTRIYIVDNGWQTLFSHRNITALCTPRNLGVAGSWNVLCRTIFYTRATDPGHPDIRVDTLTRGPVGDPLPFGPATPWAWILNDDIYSGLKETEVLDLVREAPHGYFIAPPSNWSNFLISRTCFETVGPFDEEFYPAYYEDNDYRYRLKLAKLGYTRAFMLMPKTLRVSSSIEKAPSLNHRFQENQDRYRRKWGGLPEEETFRRPFDGKKS